MSAHATATFYYTGALEEDGTIFDQCIAEPHTIVFEKGQVMMPIEQALREMQPGEIRDVRIEPEQAYGTWSGKNVESVLITDIPNGENLPVGEYINWRSPTSEHPIPVKVLSVRNGIAKFDFNHPLADKTLIYHIELVRRNEM